jgi:UvrD/REP helicase N-terminal domain/UvrD-like helicase C-terminal domain
MSASRDAPITIDDEDEFQDEEVDDLILSMEPATAASMPPMNTPVPLVVKVESVVEKEEEDEFNDEEFEDVVLSMEVPAVPMSPMKPPSPVAVKEEKPMRKTRAAAKGKQTKQEAPKAIRTTASAITVPLQAGDDDLFATLTPPQHKATTYPSDMTLQILAGPGAGKTRTLTSRVAWLVQQGLRPENIIVVTFTKKAAAEMTHRLTKIIGKLATGKLNMGTFHSVGLKFLKRHAKHLRGRVQNNGFTILDPSDSRDLIKRAMEEVDVHFKDINKGKKPRPDQIRSVISSWKARRISPQEARVQAEAKQADKPDIFALRNAAYFKRYEELKFRSNAADFDDLITFTVELLEQEPSVVSHVEHGEPVVLGGVIFARADYPFWHPFDAPPVLVDEFQDTSVLQYELVKLFGQHCRALTTVGDPDQSIYGFRNAQKENMNTMQNDFGLRTAKSLLVGSSQDPSKASSKGKFKAEPSSANSDVQMLDAKPVSKKAKGKKKQKTSPSNSDDENDEGHGIIALERNFRSAASILSAAQKVVEQDPTRMQKRLIPFHPTGEKVALIRLTNGYQEALFIAQEIQRLIAQSGGMLTYNDVSSAASDQLIETHS